MLCEGEGWSIFVAFIHPGSRLFALFMLFMAQCLVRLLPVQPGCNASGTRNCCVRGGGGGGGGGSILRSLFSRDVIKILKSRIARQLSFYLALAITRT